ncbi:MAG: ATP-binding protein [Bacteroidota bacterium]
MLIEFTVGNYLSFKEKKTFSLESTAIKEHPENVIDAGKYKLLRSAVIYGANSSGKSNLIKAFKFMNEIVVNSAKGSSTEEIKVQPFLLSIDTEQQPSYFEIIFLIEGIRYRYGFEADKKIVHSEWLFECKANKENQLFIREKDAIEVMNDFEEGKGLEIKTRDNALFLSVADQFNGTTSKKIINWFNNQVVFSGIQHESKRVLTSSLLSDSGNYLPSLVRDFLNSLYLGFNDIRLIKTEKGTESIVTEHNKYDELGNVIGKCDFQLLEQESSGTNKLYDIAGYLIYGLELGRLTIIDELDAKLHPLLTMAIIRLFNSSEYNKHNAQLIIATHDTNLLSYGFFRRDQIYFTEKNRFEATDLYSLVEYREPDGTKVRNDRSYEKDYIAGRYGAIPFFGDFSKLVNDGEGS